MFRKISSVFFTFFISVFVLSQPLSAAGEEAKDPDWVMSYFLILLFLGLSVAFLLQPTKRRDSVFTQEELDAQKEAALQKMKQGGH